MSYWGDSQVTAPYYCDPSVLRRADDTDLDVRYDLIQLLNTCSGRRGETEAEAEKQSIQKQQGTACEVDTCRDNPQLLELST